MTPSPSVEGRGNSILSCYEFDVGISNTDLTRKTDVRLTASFAQNALIHPFYSQVAKPF
jgi:hypothetical protein